MAKKRRAPTTPDAGAQNSPTLPQIYVEHPLLHKVFSVPLDEFLAGNVFPIQPTVIATSQVNPLSFEDGRLYGHATLLATGWYLARCLRLPVYDGLSTRDLALSRHKRRLVTLVEAYERKRQWLATYVLHKQHKAEGDVTDSIVSVHHPDPVKAVLHILAKELQPAALRSVLLCDTSLAALFLASVLRKYKWHPVEGKPKSTFDVYRGRLWRVLQDALLEVGYPRSKVRTLSTVWYRERQLKPIHDAKAFAEACLFLFCLFVRLYTAKGPSALLQILSTVRVSTPPEAAPRKKETKREPKQKRRTPYRGIPFANITMPQREQTNEELWSEIEYNRPWRSDLEDL